MIRCPLRIFTLAVCLATVLVTGCRDQSPAKSLPPAGNVRIVSLAPALTQMLVDAGLENHIVGVAENDAAAPPQARVVGNFLDINTEALLLVKPTHILLMSSPGQLLPRLAEQQGYTLMNFGYPATVRQAIDILWLPPGSDSISSTRTLASIDPTFDAPLKKLRDRCLAQLQAIADLTADASSPRVLLAFATGPMVVSGPGTVLDDMLTTYAHGRNAAESLNATAPELDRELILTLEPDVIVILSPEAPALTDLETDPRLAELRGLDVPAVRDHRIALINDPQTLLPGSSMTRITALLAKAVHPQLADSIDHLMAPESDR